MKFLLKLYLLLVTSNHRVFVFLLMSFLFFIPIESKIVENSGDSSLKSFINKTNYYIGVSQPSSTLQEAIDNAISHAQNMIIQNLGVNVQIEIQIENISIENDKQDFQSSYVKKNVSLNGIYSLKIKSDKIYWEKQITNSKTSYMAYVSVYFNRDLFINELINKYSEFTDNIKYSKLSNTSQNFLFLMNTYQEIIEFEKEYYHFRSLLPVEVLNNYQSNRIILSNELTDQLLNIKISLINKEDKFPKHLLLSITLKNEALDNIPVYVTAKNEEVYKTDKKGLVIINLDQRNNTSQNYSLNVIKKDEFSPLPHENTSLKFNVLSPFYYENICIFLDTSNSHINDLTHDLLNRFKKLGFQIKTKNESDFFLVCNVQLLKTIKITTYYKSEVKVTFNLFESKSNKLVKTWSYPDKQFSDFSSIGLTRYQSNYQAMNLNDLTNRKEFLYYQINEITKEMKKYLIK